MCAERSSLKDLPGMTIEMGTVYLLLAANSIRDIQKREILLWPTLAVAAAGGFYQRIYRGQTGLTILLSLGWSLVTLLFSLCSRGSVGMGDAILLAAAGIWAGPLWTTLAFFLALLLVPLFAVCLRFLFHPRNEIPFAPVLLLGFLLGFFLQ